MRAKAYHLFGGHDYSLDTELAATHIKQVLQAGSEEVYYEDIVEALLAKMVYLGNTGCKAL
jgi:hypothetical protein